MRDEILNAPTWHHPSKTAYRYYNEQYDKHIMEKLKDDPIGQWFSYDHLPEGEVRATSRLFATTAQTLVQTQEPSRERSVALRKLLEAKDAAVRGMIETLRNRPKQGWEDGDVTHIDKIKDGTD